jgi:large subunit ribosomal protein L9
MVNLVVPDGINGIAVSLGRTHPGSPRGGTSFRVEDNIYLQMSKPLVARTFCTRYDVLTMKVVLLKDVRGMGSAHSVHEVSDGHALNFLIPRKIAVPATPSAMKSAENRQKQVTDRRELDVKLVADRIAALAEEKVTITKKANEQGHLYDGVDAAEIAAATELPEEAIHLEKPIKEVGTFEVPVAVGKDFGKISIEVVAE